MTPAPTPDLSADCALLEQLREARDAEGYHLITNQDWDALSRVLAAARRTICDRCDGNGLVQDGRPEDGPIPCPKCAEVESLRSRLAQAQEEYLSALTSAQNEAEFQTERAEAAERQLAGLLRERDALAQIDPERDLAVELERVQRQLAEARAALMDALHEHAHTVNSTLGSWVSADYMWIQCKRANTAERQLAEARAANTKLHRRVQVMESTLLEKIGARSLKPFRDALRLAGERELADTLEKLSAALASLQSHAKVRAALGEEGSRG